MFDPLVINFGANKWNPRGKYRLYTLLARLFESVEGVTPFGVRLRFRPNDLTCYYFFRKDYETPLRDLIGALPAGGVFIDVGANVGNYSILSSRQVGESGLVVGFEPVATTYIRYLNHLAINQARNVIPCNVAVSATPGSAEMVFSSDSGLSYVGRRESSPGRQSQRCAMVALDDFLPALIGDREIDLMKVDVEGAELGVLRGARRLLQTRKVKRLFVEIFPANLARFGATREELWAFMEEQGYRPRYRQTEGDGYDEIFDRA